MVCRRSDGAGGGEVLSVGHGETGEELGTHECRSAEFVSSGGAADREGTGEELGDGLHERNLCVYGMGLLYIWAIVLFCFFLLVFFTGRV